MASSRFREGGGRGRTVQHDDAERARRLAASGPGRLRRPRSDRPPDRHRPQQRPPKDRQKSRASRSGRRGVFLLRVQRHPPDLSSKDMIPGKIPGSLPPSAPGLPSSRTVTSGDRRCTLVTEPNLPARPLKNSGETGPSIKDRQPGEETPKTDRHSSGLESPGDFLTDALPPENPGLRFGPHAGPVHK